MSERDAELLQASAQALRARGEAAAVKELERAAQATRCKVVDRPADDRGGVLRRAVSQPPGVRPGSPEVSQS